MTQSKQNLLKIFENIMDKTEEKYGQTRKVFEFCGIYLLEDGPYIYYPKSDSVGIAISSCAIHDIEKVKFQIAHECVHLLCLNPEQRIKATFLEEGLATYNSMQHQNKFRPQRSSYKDALRLTEKLLGNNEKIIIDLRDQAENRDISKIDMSALIGINGITEPEARLLTSKFIRY